MTQDTTPTSGAADLLELIEAYAEARHRQGHSSYNAQTATTLQAVKDALAQCFDAADMATAAAQGFRDGVAYAALPDKGEPWYGHKFKEQHRGIWRCECGKTVKETTADWLDMSADELQNLRTETAALYADYDADRAERGLSINLNHSDYYTVTEPPKDPS